MQVELGSNSVEVAEFNSTGLELGILVCTCSIAIQNRGATTLLFEATELSRKTADRRRCSSTLTRVMLVEMKDGLVPPFQGRVEVKGGTLMGATGRSGIPSHLL